MDYIVKNYVDQVSKVMSILARNTDTTDEEISMFLKENFERHLIAFPCKIHNNYSNKFTNTDSVKVLNWYGIKKPIACEHGVFFKRHDEAENLNAGFLTHILDSRSINKKKMFECEKKGDVNGVKFYNTRQKVDKIFANSYYGVQGQSSSVFYNIYTALSVTGKGQSIISTSATAFERFLCNNIKFKCMDDCLDFIAKVVFEERKYNDEDILDENITKKELMLYLVSLFEDQQEAIKNQDVLKAMIVKLTQTEVNRVYMKNNLYEFNKNKFMIQLIEKILLECDSFRDPNEIPEEIEEDIQIYWDILSEYVFFNYPVYDRINWLKTETRATVITVDTDSNFLNLEPYYNFVRDNVSFRVEEADMELTYKIINLISYILGRVVTAAYWTFTTNCNIPEEKRPIIKMKNEFFMSRVLLTDSKKNYASYMLLQEGVELPEYKRLDIKGLPIKKSNVNRNTGNFLMDLLKNEILKSPKINIKEILQKLSEFEDVIRQSFLNGETTYMTPMKVNEIESYKAPLTIASVRASMVYNIVYPETPINFPAQINSVKVNMENLSDIASLYETHPDIYMKLKESIFDDSDLKDYGITYFGIPKTLEKIPEWIIPYISVDEIIRDNLNNFLKILESIGLKTIKTSAKNLYFSNIIDF